MPAAVTILAYHRIARPEDAPLAPDLIDAYPADFAAQMRYVAGRYRVVSARDLVRALRGGPALPPRALVITFDDGYRCFRDTAWPILRRLGLPATLFVPTAFPGTRGAPFWWDALYQALQGTDRPAVSLPGQPPLPLASPADRAAAYTHLVRLISAAAEADATRLLAAMLEQCAVPPRTERYLLDWDEIAALAAEGVSIGPHTRGHQILSRATPERAAAEVRDSWTDLQARVPEPLPLFCYPHGKPEAINGAAVAAVRATGLAGACTMVPGINVVGRTNPYLLCRIGLQAGETLPRFIFKLTAPARLLWQMKGLARALPA